MLGGSFFREIQTFFILAWFLLGVCILLFVKLLISAITSTPRSTLKRDAVLFAWVALPTIVIAIAITATGTRSTILQRSFWPLLIAFPATYAALIVGNCLRQFFVRTHASPNPTAFPLAAVVLGFVLGASLHLFVENGIFPQPTDCPLELRVLTYCYFDNYEGFFFS